MECLQDADLGDNTHTHRGVRGCSFCGSAKKGLPRLLWALCKQWVGWLGGVSGSGCGVPGAFAFSHDAFGLSCQLNMNVVMS